MTVKSRRWLARAGFVLMRGRGRTGKHQRDDLMVDDVIAGLSG